MPYGCGTLQSDSSNRARRYARRSLSAARAESSTLRRVPIFASITNHWSPRGVRVRNTMSGRRSEDSRTGALTAQIGNESRGEGRRVRSDTTASDVPRLDGLRVGAFHEDSKRFCRPTEFVQSVDHRECCRQLEERGVRACYESCLFNELPDGGASKRADEVSMEVVHFEDALISPKTSGWIESVRSTGLWEVVVRLGSTFGCCATTSLSSRCCVSACQVLRSSQSSLSVREVSDLIEHEHE